MRMEIYCNIIREQTGQLLVKAQLKNKWDVCKKDWRLWTKLNGETGVGWSNELGTIVASDEWWKSRIQENRGVKKFRQSGIEPSLKFKFDRMFSGVTSTGQHAWAPSSSTVPSTDDDLDTLNVGLQGADLEEGSGDSDENVDINFENNNFRGVWGEHISSSSNTKSSGKRKEREHPEPRARKKKSSGIIAQLVSIQQQLLDSMSSRSDSTSANKDLPGCSIPEVMAELQSIPGSTDDDNFLLLTTKFLQVRRNREMWASINGIKKKYCWLQLNIAPSKNS
ncbi:L10-interacting MYB domain-containing protein [Salix suchowensis]|nr:L10-interacting MYB domain-containing protein [Salix suchowensis]